MPVVLSQINTRRLAIIGRDPSLEGPPEVLEQPM
jgi:hypothetical protein